MIGPGYQKALPIGPVNLHFHIQYWLGGSFMTSLFISEMAMTIMFFPHCLVAEGHRQGSLAR
jgi:hypothetical protein